MADLNDVYVDDDGNFQVKPIVPLPEGVTRWEVICRRGRRGEAHPPRLLVMAYDRRATELGDVVTARMTSPVHTGSPWDNEPTPGARARLRAEIDRHYAIEPGPGGDVLLHLFCRVCRREYDPRTSQLAAAIDALTEAGLAERRVIDLSAGR